MERAIRLGKPFIMLLPVNFLARKRTVSLLKRGFFKGGLIIPAPKFIPKNSDGTPKEMVKRNGKDAPLHKGVGDCFWLFGYPHADNSDVSTEASGLSKASTYNFNNEFTISRGVLGLTCLFEINDVLAGCI